MAITVANSLTQVMVEEAIVAHNVQVVPMILPAVMVHSVVTTSLGMVVVVLAARDVITTQHTVSGTTTAANTAVRNDKTMMTTTASLVAPMAGKDKWV